MMKQLLLKRVALSFAKSTLLFILSTWNAFGTVLFHRQFPSIDKAIYKCSQVPRPWPEFFLHQMDTLLSIFSILLPVIYFLYFIYRRQWKIFAEFIIVSAFTLSSVMLVSLSASDDSCLGWNHADQALLSRTQEQLEIYFQDCGRYPTAEQNLNALVTAPTLPPLCKKWQGPYTEKLPTDKYDRPLKYELIQHQGKVTALGRDGQPGGQGHDEDKTSKDPLL